MARTRATKTAPAAPADSEVTTSTSTITLDPEAGESPKVFILPSEATKDARIVSLPNPRTSQPSRYLVCPETGIYEFTKITAPKTTPRSWLIQSTAEPSDGNAAGAPKQETTVTMGSDLFVATIFDPVFLALPALADSKASKGSDEQKRLFLACDDHFDKLPQEDSHLSEILRWGATRKLMESRLSAVCDTVDAGDESMFRLNESKLLDVILTKAKRMSEGGLPSSMEEKFVKKVLEAPLMHRHVQTSASQTSGGNVEADGSTPQTESGTSQSFVSTVETDSSSVSQPSTAATSFAEEPAEDVMTSAMEASPEVVNLQRLRVAFDFICARYVPASLATQLLKALADNPSTTADFSPLNDYLASLEKIRSDAMVSRTTDYSRKRNRDEEEDAARMEKKRKMEEDKKKKASESRGVRDLKKVNTSGMKKLSAFFQKK